MEVSDKTASGGYPSAGDLLSLLGVFIGATLLGVLVTGALNRLGSLSAGETMFWSYLIQFGCTLAFALFQKRKRTAEPSRKLLRFCFGKADPSVTLLGVVWVAAVSIVIEPLLELFPDLFLKPLAEVMNMGGWAMLTSIVLAPLFEEMLFRGVLQEALTVRYGPWRGILIASAVFGAVHVIPQQAVNAFFVGLVLGYIYYRSGSLIPVVFIHCINNAVSSFAWILSGEESGMSTREMMEGGSSYWILYSAACVVLLLSVVYVVRSAVSHRARMEPGKGPEREEKVAGKDTIRND